MTKQEFGNSRARVANNEEIQSKNFSHFSKKMLMSNSGKNEKREIFLLNNLKQITQLQENFGVYQFVSNVLLPQPPLRSHERLMTSKSSVALYKATGS